MLFLLLLSLPLYSSEHTRVERICKSPGIDNFKTFFQESDDDPQLSPPVTPPLTKEENDAYLDEVKRFIIYNPTPRK